MNNFILVSILSLLFSCAEKDVIIAQTASMYDSPLIDPVIANEHPYELGLRVGNTNVNEHRIIIEIKLFGGSFYASPSSISRNLGRLVVGIEDNDKVQLGTDFVEVPRSREIFDAHPLVKGNVNWVAEDTSYDYPLTVLTKEDFKVNGMIRFTIEPKCTYEEIPFSISSKDGKLTVQRYPKLDKRICGEKK
jgi:hypothetical protein